MPRRMALLFLVAATLLPGVARRWPHTEAAPCEPEGRGSPPGHWIGCRGDAGPARQLEGLERVLLGRPVDLNQATAGDLAAVPGIGPGLAAEVVREREARGPFRSAGDLRRVRGIGPARMERARPFVTTEVP